MTEDAKRRSQTTKRTKGVRYSNEVASTSENGAGLGTTAKGGKKMRQSRTSMADVAQLAGCSQSSVSIVLNNTPGINIGEDTRKRVFDAAKSLNYKVPRSRISNSASPPPVAFVVDRLATSIEAIWSIEGAREALWPSGQLLLVAQTLDDAKIEARTLQSFVEQGVYGIIYATNHTRQIEPPEMLYDVGCPVVLLNCYSNDYAFPSVVPSEIAAGISGTNHLIEIGHERIAMITGEQWMEGAASRLTGYRRALATADIVFDPKLVREGNWQMNSGFEKTLELMNESNPPTAIFCASDRMAVGCIEALKSLGLRVPVDVSVIGFDNEDISQHVRPQLTTIQLPQAEMGRWAVDQIRSTTGARSGVYPQVKLECQLIVRDSVTPPSASARELKNVQGFKSNRTEPST